ncbi:hypothetical protein TruAng_000489 [Truncatella angustata]|nr:hypothetical protein TruAng_000489 [Truncatella angustata]
MTPQASNNGHGRGHADLEAEILAALWEEVPFPRLPYDAPPELKELVVEIENPRRVYSIHRATRRHNLQLLVEKFISQLRYGCGYDDCPTSSCFSCRRRLAGKAPIRRYSPVSARTLAIHMASQDNPEQYLCPNLDTKRNPSDAIKPLIFGPKPRITKSHPGESRKVKRSNASPRNVSAEERENIRRHLPPTQENPASKPSLVASKRNPTQKKTHNHGQESEFDLSPPSNEVQGVSINERPVRKDYRSFAANVFGSVAYKMLEWMTPSNIDAISDKAAAILEQRAHPGGNNERSTPNDSDDELFVPSNNSSAELEDSDLSPRQNMDRDQDPWILEPISLTDPRRDTSSLNGNSNANGSTRPPQSRTNSGNRARTPSKPKSLSMDHAAGVRVDGNIHEPISPISIVSKNANTPKRLVRTTSKIMRQRSSERLTNGTGDEQGLRLSSNACEHHDRESRSPAAVNGFVAGDKEPFRPSINQSGFSKVPLDQENPGGTAEAELPQSLSRLNTDLIDFLCDVLQQDGTLESHLLEPPTISRPFKGSKSSNPLRRQKTMQKTSPQHLKFEWKLFVEQSIFNVLSDPCAILASFATQDGLIDSQTLWYRMLRMTRAAPSLVFDSLWQASASLFAPPKALRSPRSLNATLVPKHHRISLSNEEAGFLLSVCFHALVAAAPLVDNATELFDMSRNRSRGSSTGQNIPLFLEYEDAFTDELAVRLARRLLAAISTRIYFDDLAEQDRDPEEGSEHTAVLDIFLSHLEPGRDISSALPDFPFTEREIHEKRVPILLLDWARTVMLCEWQGNPEVPGDGPFGGALSLIAAMHQKRKSLLLGDAVFRTEYFGDRLDSIETPVTWLACNSSRQKAHLLDHPYMFSSPSLVTYFRAINFSRMSRAYEESSSLQTRISAIVAPDSLVTDRHQKDVLQDLLKVASSKFLILDIGRKTVIRDAFDQLWRRQERELLRPLKIHLGEDSGEEGFDSGGVQQEFFRLAIAEALNPDYGAFTVDDRTRMTWFQPGSLQPEWKFELVGLLISLAVFNGLTLPITFPKALYMKLLNESVTELHHIADGWPDLANGLTTLLEWDEADGSVEDIFARTYEFSIDMFGQPISRQMEPTNNISWPQFPQYPSAETLASGNPEDAPLVTGDNREAYVSDYIRYLTDISVAPQYKAFARGFRTCLSTKSLRLLTPPLLQSMVEGTQEIDIAELRRAARYVGWDASHRTVRDFWSIVKRYDDHMKRKLLEFVTASDRVPVGGMRNVQFVVQRNGAEEGDAGHLPTAYTCYGTLLLPEYRDREVLKERLGMALENAQGFGFA